jgi:hypothetical protein
LIRFSASFLAFSGIFIGCVMPIWADSGSRTSISKTQSGYVAAVNPPNSFRLDNLTVRTTSRTNIFVVDGAQGTPLLDVGTLFVGSRVIVHGKIDAQKQELLADRVEIFAEQLPRKAAGVGLMDAPTSLTHSGQHWTGTVIADGYRLTVTPDTAVTLPAGVTDPASLPVNTWVKYKAERHQDGSLVASHVEFFPFERSDKEQKYAQSSDFKIDPPDYNKRIPGKVRFFMHTMTILADRQLADHVAKVGESLSPAWQNALADNDPAKVHFHFWILQANKAFKHTFSDEAGTVLVPSNVLARLKNDAQLAALLSSDVAGAIQQDAFRTLSTKHTEEALSWGSTAVGLFVPGPGLIGAATRPVFSAAVWTPMIQREYRVGMSYMAAAGYDVRQAPEALRQLDERHADENEAKGKDPSQMAAYLEFIYATEYGREDRSGKKTGETEYAELLSQLHSADPKLHP